MPPKKKSQANNAYFYFMCEHKKRMERKGVIFANGLRDAAIDASPSWDRMSAKEREPFERMAQQGRGTNGERYTTQGETYSEVDRREQEKIDRIRQKSAAIKNTLIVQGRNTGLPTFPIFLIHMNYYCRRENDFFPAEIALARYTIKDGIDQRTVLHEFIDLAALPLGLANKAQIHAADTTLIPIPPLPSDMAAETDNEALCLRIIDYMKGDIDENNMLQPFYTLESEIPATESMLSALTRIDGSDRVHFRYQVYPLEELFYEMKNFTLRPAHQRLVLNNIEDNGFAFKSVADEILRDDKYSYRPNIACKFHEEKDRVQHCSRSYVIRWSWHLSNYLCGNLGIEMVLNHHCPGDTALSELVRPKFRAINDSSQVFDEAIGGRSNGDQWQPREDPTLHEEANAWQTVNGQHRGSRSNKSTDIEPLRKKNTQSKALALNKLPENNSYSDAYSDADFPVLGGMRRAPRQHGGFERGLVAGRGVAIGRGAAVRCELSTQIQHLHVNHHDDDNVYEDND